MKNNTGHGNSGYGNSGDRNSGYGNSGDRNSGDGNSGDRNSGDGNSGDRNSGDRNSGYWNSGDRNSGDRNSGYGNSGNWNSGNWNSGYRNSGYGNSGNWNSGNWNSGYFNIDTPKVRIFGKEIDIKREDLFFPDFLCFKLTEWINESDMTEEQKNNPDNAYYKTTGGILETYEYKEAFKKSYNKLSKEEKEIQTKQLKELPNFDKDIFFEISGIDIDIQESNQVELTLDEIAKKFDIDVNNLKIKK